MKKLLTSLVGIIISICAFALLALGLVFHEYIMGVAYTIALIALVTVFPVLFIIDYVKMNKRIKYLEELLREKNIFFDD